MVKLRSSDGILRSMVAAPALSDLSTLEADALRSLLLAHHQQLLSNNNEIERLKLVIAGCSTARKATASSARSSSWS